MRVLVMGASGFIGRAVAHELLRRGHEVVCASRRPDRPATVHGRRDVLAVDFAGVPSSSWWVSRLAGIDAVVNAVGILREKGTQTFRALHTEGPAQLFKACAEAGVVVVQISALGADESGTSGYHRSKKAADDALRALPVRAAVVQPSLVYGGQGASSAMFRQMATLPVLALPHGGLMQVQPVHVKDVVAGVVALLEAPPGGVSTIAFVGPRALGLRDYLAHLRSSLGIGGRLRVLPLPEGLFRWGARIAARLPGSVLDSETADMLLRGNTAPSEPFARLLGREPTPVDQFIPREEAATLRTEAVLGAWLPALRVSIALLWIWTGIVSLGLYPVRDSMALLGRVGLHGAAGYAALYGAAALDLLLGVLTLVVPRHRRGLVWAAQVLLIGGYTLLITLFLPEYWLHPYGPVSKNIPLLAAIALLWSLEQRPASAQRGA